MMILDGRISASGWLGGMEINLPAFLIAPADFGLLIISRVMLRSLAAGVVRTYSVLYLVYVYASVVLAFCVATFAQYRMLSWSDFGDALDYAVRWPLLLTGSGWVVVCAVPMVLSSLLFGSILLGAFAMQWLRFVLRPIALLMVDRLASSKKGVFTSIATALAIISGLIAAFMKA